MADDGFSKKQLEQLEKHVIEPLIDGMAEAIGDSMNASFAAFGQEFGRQLAEAMAPLFNAQNERLDTIIQNTSSHYRGLEARLAELERWRAGNGSNGAPKNGDKK